jgi:predicted GNAT family acetyltransferase
MSDRFSNNSAGQRFELDVEGQLAFCDYRRHDDVLLLTHVEAAMPLRGTGAADRLMAAIMSDVRAKGAKVKPLCSYAVAWMRRHPENDDLLA